MDFSFSVFLTKQTDLYKISALTSVRAERFTSTKYHSEDFGQKKSVCTSLVTKYRFKDGTPTQWSLSYHTPDLSRMRKYMFLRRYGNGNSWGNKLVSRTRTQIKLNPQMTSAPGFEPGPPLHPHVNCILLLNTYLHSCLQHGVGGRAKRKASEWREKREKAIIVSILTLYSPVCKVQQTFYVPEISAIISYMHARDFYNSNTF